MAQCSQCGKSLPSDAFVCPCCDSRLEAAAPEFQARLEALKQKARNDPMNPQIYAELMEMASLCGEMGDLNRTILIYRFILDKNTQQTEAALGLGQALIAKGQYEEALEQFLSVSNQSPAPNPLIDLMLCECYYKLEQFDTAWEYAKRLDQYPIQAIRKLIE
ncbi:MAG: hypothetical protein C4524_12765 [Candidatus Zixiibacteriota bacterium]|nr:MAG: hypothetical protein C4524_12765 [candidate division Zixibacteria bacterium]